MRAIYARLARVGGAVRGESPADRVRPDPSDSERMREINLLSSVPKIIRDVSARKANKEENRRLALKFEREYFDGTREQGYGGYTYDGRWVAVAPPDGSAVLLLIAPKRGTQELAANQPATGFAM